MFLAQKNLSHHSHYWLWTLLACSLLSITLGITMGSTSLSSFSFKNLLTHHITVTDSMILFQLRLPRVLCAFIVGGLLSLAGALMQTLLRNPLADPYILGASGGAAVATLFAMLLGIETDYLNVCAFIGSLSSMLFIVKAVKKQGITSPLYLLLNGVVLATGWTAIISFILTISPQENLRGMLFWMMGDLSYAHFSFLNLALLLAALIISFWLAKPLNILYRGNLVAQTLGINTKRLYLLLYLISSLLTACAVSMAGCIGFVGLIVPHILRLLVTSDHRFLLPASVLLGGTLLTLSDTVARSILSPTQLPVGIVTAAIGAPILLFLLKRSYST